MVGTLEYEYEISSSIFYLCPIPCCWIHFYTKSLTLITIMLYLINQFSSQGISLHWVNIYVITINFKNVNYFQKNYKNIYKYDYIRNKDWCMTDHTLTFCYGNKQFEAFTFRQRKQ